LEPLGGSREDEGFALRVFVGGLRGDGGGFGVVFGRVIDEATRRRKGIRARKQKDLTEGEKRGEQQGFAEKGSETLSEERRKQNRKTSHNVCSRQVLDDANRLKCSKYQ